MKVTRKTLLWNNILTICILVIGITTIMIYSSIIGNKNVESTSEKFKEFYLEENKNLVKQEVLNQLEAIRYEKTLVIDRELDIVKHEILHLGHIIRDMDIKYIVDDAERQKQAVMAFEKATSFDDEHLYFTFDSLGNLLKSGMDDSIVGTNFLDSVDENGVYYVRKMLESVESTEGLFVTYSWPKEINGHPEIKTSYCYYLPEFDIVVGAGVYHSDIDKSVMDNVYQRLNTYYENEEDYIFVMSNDGICKVHAEPEMIDSDITGTFNHDGRNLHDMFVETSKEDEGGFVSYTYNKLDEATVLEKISYTIALDDWDAYLAMGFYTEDLLEVNDLNESELESQNSKENFIVTIGLTIVIILVLLLIRKGSYLQSELMKQEEAIFSELLKQVTEGIVIMGERKVLYANDKAVTLFGHHVEDTFNRGIEYLKNDDDVYEIENENATYYVEISKKNLLYKGIDSEMYLAKNITNTYLQAHNYQRISMIDELSGLQNRRALIRDFTEKSTNKTCKRVIGLIDLDFFKNVNDSYGHERGDDIIVDLGELFTNRLRKTDKFYRYGGEEFVVLFMNISIIEAKEVLEKLNEEMKQMSLKKYGFEQTFSGGIVSIQNEVSIDLDGYISKADKLMYQAKLKGRNRIEFELDSDNI